MKMKKNDFNDATDLDPDDVADGAHVQLGGHPGQQPAGEGGGPGHDMTELELVLKIFLFRLKYLFSPSANAKYVWYEYIGGNVT